MFAHSMLGPLFLAMDRFLIVAFPHNFQLHEKKMRMIKIMFFALTTAPMSLGFIHDQLIKVGIFILYANLVVQLIACIVLYTIIVVKIVLAERKMSKHRHVGNRFIKLDITITGNKNCQ